MENPGDKKESNNKFRKMETFTVPYSLGEIQEDLFTNTNIASQAYKEELINEAFKYHSQGQISEAAKYYKSLIDIGFNDNRVFSYYGAILQDLGKSKEAELFTRKAIEMKPDLAENYINLGNILQSLGRFEEAVESTRKAIEIKPDFPGAHNNLGDFLRRLGRYKEAELSFRRAIELNPDIPECHTNLGILLNNLGKYEEAESLLRKAIELNPNYEKAHFILGTLLKTIGKQTESEISLKNAIRIKPSYKSYFIYASCLFEKKEFDASIENLYKAKSLTDDKDWLLIIEISIKNIQSAKKKSETSSIVNSLKGLLNQKKQNTFKDRKVDRLIINRNVEDELIPYLLTIKTNQLTTTTDSRYGSGVCSDFSLFDNDSKILSKLSNDIEKICKKELGLKEFYVFDSFFNIFVSGSGQPPHRHMTLRDKNFYLISKKYSLVYYLDVGDQNNEAPGILKLHNPEEKILPTNGMIVIIPADRYHSVIYKGTKKRVMIGVNFYGL